MTLEIKYSPSKVIKVLTVATLALIVLSSGALLSNTSLWINLFYLGTDYSIPTWFASVTLLWCSVLLALIARSERIEATPFFRYWAFLSILFALMSVDEVARIHENLGDQIHDLSITNRAVDFISFSPFLKPFFSYSWVLLGIPFVAAFALIYVPFVVALPRRVRLLFVVSGIVYVSGALCLEMLSARYAALFGQGSAGDVWFSTVEESFEMFGVLLFIHALHRYIELYTPGFKLQFSAGSK